MATEASKIPFVEAAAPSTPAASRVVIYAKSDGLMYSKDDAGTETLMSSGGSGSVATDAIWDAAGDLAVGSGANTAAKLTIGNAGAVLARINGAVAWNAGTAFPTAATGDRFWRTDQLREYTYDGTRWVTTETFFAYAGSMNMSAINAGNRFRPALAGQDIWLVNLDLSVAVFSTNNGSNYWTYTLDKRASNDGATTIITKDTSGLTGGTWNHVTDSIGASAAFATVFNFIIQASVKTGNPSNLQITGGFTYKLIGT